MTCSLCPWIGLPEGMEDTENGVMSVEEMQAAMAEAPSRMIFNFMPNLKKKILRSWMDGCIKLINQ